jgi:hypothetical protein
VRHLTLLLVLSLAATASTAVAAQAASPVRASGVVLSVASDKHALRIVQSQHVAGATYRGTLPSAVSPGAQVSYSTTGRRASRFVVTGHVDHVLVSGTVVRDGKQLALRLSDGSLLVLPSSRHLKVGSFAHVAVRFPRSGGSPTAPGAGTTPTTPGVGCAKADCSFDMTGSISAIDDATGALTVVPIGGGAALTAKPGTGVATTDVFVGDFVHVTGTQSAATGTYTLTSLDLLIGCDTPDCTIEFDATVDDIQPDGFSVADDQGDEYPFLATPAQLSTIQLGDLVHIVAVQDPTTADYRVRTMTVLGSDPNYQMDPTLTGP